MNAVGYVALAKQAAHEALPSCIGATAYRLFVDADGYWKTGMRRDKAIMSAALSAENTSSEYALVRALLASAVTYTEAPGYETWVATLGNWQFARRTKPEAGDVLLDAVLDAENTTSRPDASPSAGSVPAASIGSPAPEEPLIDYPGGCYHTRSSEATCAAEHRPSDAITRLDAVLAERLPTIALAAVNEEIRKTNRSGYANGWRDCQQALGEILWPLALDEYDMPRADVDGDAVVAALRELRIIDFPENDDDSDPALDHGDA